MKQLLLCIAMMGCGIVANAQLVTVKSIDKVNLDMSVDQAEISPDGTFAIVSSNADPSLTRVSFADGKATKVVDNGILYLLQFSDDSRSIAYVEQTSDENHLMYKTVKSLDLDNGQVTTVQPATRTLNGIRVNRDRVMVVDDAILNAQAVKNGRAQRLAPGQAAPVPYIYYGELRLDNRGQQVALNPNGYGESYVWPSLSPDGTKVLYFWVGHGTYICDLDGSNVQFVADLRAPRWLDDATIVGMRDYDDGVRFTESTIVVSDLKGATQDLTTVSQGVAMYPSVSATGERIAFTNTEGQLYVINLQR